MYREIDTHGSNRISDCDVRVYLPNRRTFIERGLIGSSLLADPWLAQGSPLREDNAAVQVINAGVSGNNTADLLARIDKDCLEHKAGLVIFMAGTNDMNSKKFIPLPEYEKNMQQMIGMMKQIRARIMLMNLLPVYEPYLFTRHERNFYEPEGHSGRLKQMNEAIKKLAVQNKTAFLDLYSIFNRVGNIGTAVSSLIKNEANSKTTDGLHPTGDGYRVIAVAAHAGLVCNRWAENKKIVCFGDSITLGDGVDGGYNYPSYLKKLLS